MLQKKSWFIIIMMLSIFMLWHGTKALKGENMTMKLVSDSFKQGGNIPDLYTCKGKNISPPLSWNGAPEKTKSFVLICDDPDAPAGTWDHWLLFNIPASASSLSQHIPAQDHFNDGSRHGKNSWGRNDYGGPCPPSGKHRYYFKIYALDTILSLSSGAHKRDIENAMHGHILSHAELMGYYQK